MLSGCSASTPASSYKLLVESQADYLELHLGASKSIGMTMYGTMDLI